MVFLDLSQVNLLSKLSQAEGLFQRTMEVLIENSGMFVETKFNVTCSVL